MDQVLLPFVVSQDHTFTTEEDNDVNFKCPKESLHKRQITIYQIYNAKIGDKSHEWCDMVCGVTVKMIQEAEKNVYDDDIHVFGQKKAWIDKVVMR